MRFFFLLLPDNSLKVAALSDAEFHPGNKGMEFGQNGGPAYHVGIRNITGQSLLMPSLIFGEDMVIAENNGGAAGNSNMAWSFATGLPYEIPDVALVKWLTADGVKHEVEVPLAGRLPDNLNGRCLCFIIDNDEEVRFGIRPWQPFVRDGPWINDDFKNE